MSKRLKLAASFVICVLLLSPGLVRAQTLADKVPDSALIYVGWQGIDHMPAGYDKTRTKALIDATGIKQIIEQSLPALLERLAKEDPNAAEPIKFITALGGPLWKHPTALYFAGIDFAHPQGPRPQGALICDAGGDAANLLQQFKKFADIIQNDNPGAPITAFQDGNLVVLNFGYDQDGKAIAGKDPAIKSLVSAAGFKEAMSKVLKEPVACVYLNIEGAIAQVDTFVKLAGDNNAQQKWPAAKDALGLAGLHRAIWTGGFVGEDWANQCFIAAPKPRAGLMMLLEGKPLTDDSYRAIPKGATWAGVGQFDLGAFVTEVRNAAGKVDPQAQQMMDQALGAGGMAVGIPQLRKDLFEALGTEWAFYLDPSVLGNGPLGMTVVNKPRNAAAVEKSLGALERAVDGQANFALQRDKMRITFDTFKSGNATIHYVQAPVVAPSWTVANGNLYFGLYPQAVTEAVAFGAAKNEKGSILDNPDFLAARKKALPEGVQAQSFTYVDLPNTAGQTYPLLVALSQAGVGFADMAGAKTPPMFLPPLSKFKSLLTPAAAFCWSDDSGWYMRGVAPFPGAEVLGAHNGPAAFAAPMAVAGLAMPAMGKARQNANRVKAASNMRQIGQGAMLYANDHNGKYPANLAPLVLEADLHPDVFFSPNSGNMIPPDVRGRDAKEVADYISKNSDYVYLGGSLNMKSPADQILAYEKPGVNGGQGINVLFNDGHVDWMNVQQAMDQVKKQQGE